MFISLPHSQYIVLCGPTLIKIIQKTQPFKSFWYFWTGIPKPFYQLLWYATHRVHSWKHHIQHDRCCKIDRCSNTNRGGGGNGHCNEHDKVKITVCSLMSMRWEMWREKKSSILKSSLSGDWVSNRHCTQAKDMWETTQYCGTQKHCVCVSNTHRRHGTKGLVVSEMRTCWQRQFLIKKKKEFLAIVCNTRFQLCNWGDLFPPTLIFN